MAEFWNCHVLATWLGMRVAWDALLQMHSVKHPGGCSHASLHQLQYCAEADLTMAVCDGSR